MTALKPGDHFALADYTPCDRAGNAGATQSLGPSCRSVEEAKQVGFAFGRSMHPNAALSWKQFSDTTWGLMAGGGLHQRSRLVVHGPAQPGRR